MSTVQLSTMTKSLTPCERTLRAASPTLLQAENPLFGTAYHLKFTECCSQVIKVSCRTQWVPWHRIGKEVTPGCHRALWRSILFQKVDSTPNSLSLSCKSSTMTKSKHKSKKEISPVAGSGTGTFATFWNPLIATSL